MASPVHVGEEYDVTIETVGSKGDGVAKIKGYVVFIPKVNEGAKIRIRVTKTLDKVGFGEVVASAPSEEQEDNNHEEQKEIQKEESDIIPEEEGADVPDSESESEEESVPEAEMDEE